MILSWPIHSLLFACYPILNLLDANADEARFSDSLASFAVVLLSSAGLVALSRVLLADWRRAGLFASLFTALFFSYAAVVARAEFFGPPFSALVLPASIAVLLGGFFLLRHHPRDPRKATLFLNVVAVVMVALATTSVIGQAVIDRRDLLASSAVEDAGGNPELDFSLDVGARDELPDIYYIVLDAYTRGDVLRDFFLYDNSEFLDQLRALGFFVADRSVANHSFTALALPTVLDLKYLTELRNQVGRRSNSYEQFAISSNQGRVPAALRAAGYRIINIATGHAMYDLAGVDEYVALDTATRRLNEFEEALFGMTPLPELPAVVLGETMSLHEGRRRRIRYAMEQLAEMPKRGGPKFIFAHIVVPHSPYIFGAEGEPRALDYTVYSTYSDRQIREFVTGYRDQVQYLNGLVINMLTRIVRDSKMSPVIILQGDHGSRIFKSLKPKDTCLIESYAILNALRLPGVEEERLYPQISPVNTFRLVFDSYFGTELGLLPDRSYFAHPARPLSFQDISDRSESCTSVWATREGPVRIRIRH